MEGFRVKIFYVWFCRFGKFGNSPEMMNFEKSLTSLNNPIFIYRPFIMPIYHAYY